MEGATELEKAPSIEIVCYAFLISDFRAQKEGSRSHSLTNPPSALGPAEDVGPLPRK
jgi:hypothetical protein